MLRLLYYILVWPFVLLFRLLWAALTLTPYVAGLLIIGVILWFFFNNGLSFPFGGNEDAGNDNSTVSTTEIYKLEWKGEQIFFEGKEIDELEFETLAKKAKQIGAKIECTQTSSVTYETANRRQKHLRDIGVLNSGCD